MSVTPDCTVACEAAPICTICGMRKRPHGRSVALEMENGMCGHDCTGYNQEPRAGHFVARRAGEEPRGMTVHIYTAPWQSATKYRVPGIIHLFKTPPRSLVFVGCCRKKRHAANVELQVFYDLTRARCMVGKGCR